MARNIADLWRGASLIQRALLLGIVLACAGAAALLVGWARQPDMALLYSGLELDEASKICERIREAGTTPDLRDGGTSVYVPQKQVYSLRVTLASAGLPAGGQAGFRILDDEKLGTSPFSQRVNFIRALGGELARTIKGGFDGVAHARVLVARPERNIFGGEKSRSSASVTLRLKPGWRLTSTNVAAIVHLVAGSVDGLSPENVSVVSNGKLVSEEEGGDGQARQAGKFWEYKRQIEEDLAKQIEGKLAAVLGPGRASVMVAVVIDSDGLESQTTKYGPDKGVLISEKITSKTTTGSGPKAGAGGADTKEEETESEYKVTETTELTRKMAGKVKSKTISAIVDLSPPPKKEGAEEAPAETKLLAITDVEELIKTGVGFQDTTDTLTVKEASFFRPPEPVDPGAEEGFFTKDFILDMARRISLGILVIGALLALRMFRGAKSKGEAPALAAGGQNLLPGVGQEGNPELLRAHISRALQQNPEEVKQLFLSWAENEKGEK